MFLMIEGVRARFFLFFFFSFFAVLFFEVLPSCISYLSIFASFCNRSFVLFALLFLFFSGLVLLYLHVCALCAVLCDNLWSFLKFSFYLSKHRWFVFVETSSFSQSMARKPGRNMLGYVLPLTFWPRVLLPSPVLCLLIDLFLLHTPCTFHEKSGISFIPIPSRYKASPNNAWFEVSLQPLRHLVQYFSAVIRMISPGRSVIGGYVIAGRKVARCQRG